MLLAVSLYTSGCNNKKFWLPILYLRFLHMRLVRKAPTLNCMCRSIVPIEWSSIKRCYSIVFFFLDVEVVVIRFLSS